MKEIKNIYPTRKENIEFSCEQQDSYYGGGQVIKYNNGEPIVVIIEWSDKTKIEIEITQLSAWINSIEDNYCKLTTVSGEKLTTRQLRNLK